MGALLERYSDVELALLVDFFERSHAVMASEAEKLTDAANKARRRR